jgi:hypothetical protein
LPVLHTTLLRFSLASQHAAAAGVCECSLSTLFDGNQVLMKKFVCKLLDSNRQDLAEPRHVLPAAVAGAGADAAQDQGRSPPDRCQQVVRVRAAGEDLQGGNAEQLGILLEDLDLRLQTLEQQLQPCPDGAQACFGRAPAAPDAALSAG